MQLCNHLQLEPNKLKLMQVNNFPQELSETCAAVGQESAYTTPVSKQVGHMPCEYAPTEI